MPDRRTLVVVRCGDDSLHHKWLSNNRTWDLAVSSFSRDLERPYPEADFVHRRQGGKWDGLFDFFASFPQTLEAYDYFWFPDDDLAATPSDVEGTFEAMRRYGLALAQPSLSKDSYLSHLITLSNPAFEYRNVNFVELMAPALSRSLLRAVLPLLASTRSGFGLDFIWQRLVDDPRRQVAIIDSVSVTHTRPFGGALHHMMKTQGMTAAGQEQDQMLERYGGRITIEATTGGMLKSRQYVRSRWLAATIAAAGWIASPSGHRGFSGPIPARRFVLWTLRHWLFSLTTSLNLSRLELPIAEPATPRTGG